MSEFKPINQPYMHGIEAIRADGIAVEVVRCYAGEWAVFLTRNGHVVACSIRYHRDCEARKSKRMGKHEATAIARGLVKVSQ